MTEEQIKFSDQLLKLLKEHSGCIDKDQLWFFFVKDFEDEELDKSDKVFFAISILEEKNFLEWLPGGHKIQIKSAGLKAAETGILQYEQDRLDREQKKYVKIENSNINYGVNNGGQSISQDYSSSSPNHKSIKSGTINKKNRLKNWSVIATLILAIASIVYYLKEILK